MTRVCDIIGKGMTYVCDIIGKGMIVGTGKIVVFSITEVAIIQGFLQKTAARVCQEYVNSR